MIRTKEELKGLFGAGEVQTEAKMSDLIDSCYNDGVMPDAYEVVTSMPTTIPLGKLVLYNGTLWRGLKSGESTLAEGTPWPVSGFKECVGYLTSSASGIVATIKKNNITSLSFVRTGTGSYYAYSIDFLGEAYVLLQINNLGTHGVAGQYFLTQSYGNSNNRLYVSTYSVSSGLLSDAALNISYFTLRVYPK